MSEPLGEPLSSELTERYLRTRGIRYFRGQHDGECFFATDADGRRLHVHLGISRWHSDMFTIRVAPACFFPAADGAAWRNSPTPGISGTAESPRSCTTPLIPGVSVF